MNIINILAATFCLTSNIKGVVANDGCWANFSPELDSFTTTYEFKVSSLAAEATWQGGTAAYSIDLVKGVWNDDEFTVEYDLNVERRMVYTVPDIDCQVYFGLRMLQVNKR